MLRLADDLIIGAKAISEETGLDRRLVYRLTELGKLPAFKVGGQLMARRSELAAYLSAQSETARQDEREGDGNLDQ